MKITEYNPKTTYMIINVNENTYRNVKRVCGGIFFFKENPDCYLIKGPKGYFKKYLGLTEQYLQHEIQQNSIGQN